MHIVAVVSKYHLPGLPAAAIELGVTYVTLLPSFARGHFAVHLIAHFEGIDH